MTQRIDNLKDMKMPAGTRDAILYLRLLFLMAWTKGSHFALARYHKFRELPSTHPLRGQHRQIINHPEVDKEDIKSWSKSKTYKADLKPSEDHRA